MTGPSIGLYGSFGWGNLGDAAIQESMLHDVREHRPDARFLGISLNPTNTEEIRGVDAVPILRTWHPTAPRSSAGSTATAPAAAPRTAPTPVRLLKSFLRPLRPFIDKLRFCVGKVRVLRELDLLVISGGGQITDDWGGPWDHPWSMLSWCACARIAGTPVAVVSVGAGPIDSPVSRRLFFAALRLVTYRSVRDNESREILLDLMDEAALRIFDLSDDFVEFFTNEEHRELFRKNIEYCCTHSDLVFTVNQHVADKHGPYNENTQVVPNSTTFSNFQRSGYRPIPLLRKLREAGGPILGCTGIINRIRIDYDLLEQVVTNMPDAHFVFIGSADPSFVQLAARHRNMHHHAQVAYDELPDWIHGFDAAIIPFRINEHTRGNDLLKFHDHLAMGKSVVCTNTGGAWKFDDLIHVADGVQDFERKIRDALDPVPDEMRELRIEMARQNSSLHRTGEIEGLIRTHLEARP